MGPFRRTRTSLRAVEVASDADAAADSGVVTFEYRRLGDALATVVVELEQPPAADAILRITAQDSAHEVDPMLITHDAPGTDGESHRLWFVTDLSQVMFGDAEFALVAGAAEHKLPEPAARPAWEDDSPAITSAWSQSELTAALAALEGRCRSAERLAAALRATTPTVTQDDALTQKLTARLTSAHREIEALQELLDTREAAYRAVKDVVDATAADRDARQAEVDALREAEGRMSKLVAATLAEVQAERENLLKKVQDTERERQELRAQMDAQADELAQAKAALHQQQERFGAVATPAE
jgi:hypothetical protein